MTDYCVGCDNIVGGESQIISKVAKVLEEAGNNAEQLNVGPNYVQSKGLSSSSSGKVAVFIVGGSDIGTYIDFKQGLERGYYHYKYIWFAFCSWTATTWITCDELKNRGLVRAHDDNFSSQSAIAPYLGKSADNFFQDNKSIMNYVCGQTPEELAKKILGGGGTSDDSNSSSSSIKEALKKAIAGWDGYVELNVKEDTVYVNKIPDPTTATLIIDEYNDAQYDSVTVTDINPQTVNILTLTHNGYTLTLKDDLLIERFGEIPSQIEVMEGTEINSLEDLKSYLQLEWGKIRREDGRQVELKVDDNPKWQSGQWARVYLPSFFIDDYMYISKVSHDEDNTGNGSTGITLVDYPPSFGVEIEEEEIDETEDIEEEVEDEQ